MKSRLILDYLDSNDALIDTFNYDKGFIESFLLIRKQEISLSCTSHFADFSRVSGRKTNQGSQQVYFPTDKGLEFSALTVQDILWGRK
jgi:hypothetical protein